MKEACELFQVWAKQLSGILMGRKYLSGSGKKVTGPKEWSLPKCKWSMNNQSFIHHHHQHCHRTSESCGMHFISSLYKKSLCGTASSPHPSHHSPSSVPIQVALKWGLIMTTSVQPPTAAFPPFQTIQCNNHSYTG